MERTWLFLLMISPCLSLTFGVIRSLLKSLVNWLSKKVSISYQKMIVVISDKLINFNIWLLWTIQVVVEMIFLIDLNVISSPSTWPLLHKEPSRTFMVVFLKYSSTLRNMHLKLSPWDHYLLMQLLVFGMQLRENYSQPQLSSITTSHLESSLVSSRECAVLLLNQNTKLSKTACKLKIK